MATNAQITANRANAALSTGPARETGKVASAGNSLSHGLSSKTFSVLPHEDRAAYAELLEALRSEHSPETPTENILVDDMAQARWKLLRIASMEHELLSGTPESPLDGAPALTRWFHQDCGREQALLKLDRYENSARRSFYKALSTLRRLRLDALNEAKAESRQRLREFEAKMEACLNAPPPLPSWLEDHAAELVSGETNPNPAPAPAAPISIEKCKTNPMPDRLRSEWERHKRRDPLFDPHFDRSQMSNDLRKWFDKHPRPVTVPGAGL
jgi:hypothetical protein